MDRDPDADPGLLPRAVPRQLLGQLNCFLAVANSLSFRQAADLLGRSQPAVTEQIRQLEDVLGAQLFARNTRHVRLTAAGDHLLGRARRVLTESSRLVSDMREHGDQPFGQVVASFSPTIAASLAPMVLGTLEADDEALGVRVLIREDLGLEMFAAVRSGAADFGFGPYVNVPNDLVFQPAYRQEFYLIVHRDHRLARHGRPKVADLQGEPLLCPAPGSTARAVLDTALNSVGLTAQPRYEALQYPTLFALASARLGATVMPRSNPGLLKALDLVALQFEDQPLTRMIGVIVRRDATLSPAAETLIGIFRRMAAAVESERPGSPTVDQAGTNPSGPSGGE